MTMIKIVNLKRRFFIKLLDIAEDLKGCLLLTFSGHLVRKKVWARFS